VEKWKCCFPPTASASMPGWKLSDTPPSISVYRCDMWTMVIDRCGPFFWRHCIHDRLSSGNLLAHLLEIHRTLLPTGNWSSWCHVVRSNCWQTSTRRSQHSQECKDPRRQCFFVTRDLWPFNPKINGFPVLIFEHFWVKFGDTNCIGFELSCGIPDRHI